MQILRTFDAGVVNTILNHSEVHKWVALDGQGPLDASALLANPAHVCLLAADSEPIGCFLFICHEPGVYEVHTNFLPEGRGRRVLKAAKDAVSWMFIHTDCMEVLTQVPVDNRAADWLTRQCGFVLEFERPAAFPRNGEMIDNRYYALRFNDWVKLADELEARGHWFHERLHAEKATKGRETINHPEDGAHDRYVGMAVSMIFSGNPAKGIRLYNRWARFAGYATIDVVSIDPLRLDIKDGIIRMCGNDFTLEDTPCR